MLDPIAHNRELLSTYTRRLQLLEQQHAKGGDDPSVTIQIEDIRRELTRLNREYQDMTAVHAPGSSQTLKPLTVSLQKYDGFMTKFVREFQEWNGDSLLKGAKFEQSVVASLRCTDLSEHVFTAQHRDNTWKIQAEDANATNEMTKLIERNAIFRDLLAHAAQAKQTTLGAVSPDAAPCLFVPYRGTSNQQLLVLYGLRSDFHFDTGIDVILTTLLNTTENLSKPRLSDYIETAIYNTLKQVFGYVSDEMYNRQYFLFNQRLEMMTVHFEPIIYLSPDKPRIYGWEALARDSNSALAPVDLFQMAELWGTRFKLQLDMYFLEVATTKYPIDPQGQIMRKHHILPLSVNVYPESLVRTRYYETLKRIGAKGNMPLDNLFLEISEKMPIPIVEGSGREQHYIEAFREKLYRFMDLDVRFSIDDFGVGYASSSRLSRFGPACIKIDRDALSDTFGHFTFTYVLGLARRMPGYTQVVVEGYDQESKFTLRHLYGLGVRYIQGHTYGRARPTVDNQLPKEIVQQIRTELKDL
jgi:EAL domain-containing protein (putative c-di-GMP-specific phosphodiesterase class I)